MMSDKPLYIFRSHNPDEYWMDERIFVREVMNSPDENDLSLAICRIKIGVTTQLHSLKVTEWYIIEKGMGLMEIDGKTARMSIGDCVRIEPDQAQRITNTGKSDLIFKSICRPRFTPKAYTNLERKS